jgi:hypothetical protein
MIVQWSTYLHTGSGTLQKSTRRHPHTQHKDETPLSCITTMHSDEQYSSVVIPFGIEAMGALGASAQRFIPLEICALRAGPRLDPLRRPRALRRPQAETHARTLEYFRARIAVALQRSIVQQGKASMCECVPAHAATLIHGRLRHAVLREMRPRTSAHAITPPRSV